MHYETTFITKNRTEFFVFRVPFGSLLIFQTKAPRYLETKNASFRFSCFLTKRLSSPQAFVFLFPQASLRGKGKRLLSALQ